MMRGWEDRIADVHNQSNAVIIEFSIMIGYDRFFMRLMVWGSDIHNLI